ncbi:MAG: cobyrinate a,c-diamide synthase [Deltaproteobacteria bacterium]|nr:cobyrinate a,c-diamide synthase [Deltaproteobacteria bacterium]
MMKKPAFLIAAAKSGGGKTTLTMGIMAALIRRGYDVQPFKCGPDFIDPTLHKLVTGNISYNLDLKMMGNECCKQTFHEKGRTHDVIVIEGVMGLFDGGVASSAELAKTLDISVVIVIDAQSSAESAVAVLKGFEVFDPSITLAGVIFNKIGSERHRRLIYDAVLTNSSVPVLGFMPRDAQFSIPERHLGLFMGDERPLSNESINQLVAAVEQHLDLETMLKSKVSLSAPAPKKRVSHPRPRKKKYIAIAKDDAFSFYYPQNIEMLHNNGFEIVPFSPLHDESIPDRVDMIYFGGGYPENFAKQLSENRLMIEQIHSCHVQGIHIYGECGGFMYLCNSLIDKEQHEYSMVGIFTFRTVMNRRLRSLGYRQVRLQKKCLLGPKGVILHGHEFHYSKLETELLSQSSGEIELLYKLDNNSQEGYSVGSAIGSYVHLHFGNDSNVITHIYNQLG